MINRLQLAINHDGIPLHRYIATRKKTLTNTSLHRLKVIEFLYPGKIKIPHYVNTLRQRTWRRGCIFRNI